MTSLTCAAMSAFGVVEGPVVGVPVAVSAGVGEAGVPVGAAVVAVAVGAGVVVAGGGVEAWATCVGVGLGWAVAAGLLPAQK